MVVIDDLKGTSLLWFFNLGSIFTLDCPSSSTILNGEYTAPNTYRDLLCHNIWENMTKLTLVGGYGCLAIYNGLDHFHLIGEGAGTEEISNIGQQSWRNILNIEFFGLLCLLNLISNRIYTCFGGILIRIKPRLSLYFDLIAMMFLFWSHTVISFNNKVIEDLERTGYIAW